MKLISLAWALAAAVLFAASSASAAPASLGEFLKPLLVLPADSGGAWEDLDADRAIRWTAGPTMTDKPSPDGNFFARVGQGSLAGRQVAVVATGARSMVFSVYIRDPGPAMEPDALAASLRQSGFSLTPARCDADPRGAARRWYRLTLAKKKPAYLFAGPVSSGGAAYTLYLGDLPPAAPRQAPASGGRCPGQ